MEFTIPLPDFNDHSSAAYKNWQLMKQRFKEHILSQRNKKTSSRNDTMSLLMFINRDAVINIMKAFVSNSNHKIDTLNDVLESIEDLCMPSLFVLYERFKFFSIQQRKCEDVNKFITELYTLADRCELQQQQKYVLERIVDGVCSRSVRELLRHGAADLQLEKVMEICGKVGKSQMKKCCDVLSEKLKGEEGEDRGCVSHTERGKARIVSKKCGKEKIARQNGVLAEDRIQQTSTVRLNRELVEEGIQPSGKPALNRELFDKEIRKTVKIKLNRKIAGEGIQQKGKIRLRRNKVKKHQANTIGKIDGQTDVSVKLLSSSANSATRKPKDTSVNKRQALSVNTLRKKRIGKLKGKCLVSESRDMACLSKTNATKDTAPSSILDTLLGAPTKPITLECEEAIKVEELVDSHYVSRESFVSEVCPVSSVRERQVDGREVCVHLPCMSSSSELKAIPEIHSLEVSCEYQNTGGTRKCARCGQMFSTFCVCQGHQRNHASQTGSACHVCDVDMTAGVSFSRHVNQARPGVVTPRYGDSGLPQVNHQHALPDHHTPWQSKESKATGQDYAVASESTKVGYRKRKKEDKNEVYTCDPCGLTFHYPSKLKLHLMSKHNATKPFMCEICGSSFAEKNMLATHKNIHSGEKKHECPTCGRQFLLKTTLRNHTQTHLDLKPHTCPVCGLGFKLSYYLKSHMKTHAEHRERPHVCSTCGVAFLKLAQLKNHERRHTGEKPYRCSVCSRQFSQLSSMKKHIKNIHEGVKPKDRFSCEYCGLPFTHSCKLKLHLMKHTGERPFSCTICDASYREKHQLTTHMKIHTGSEPFKCPFCARRFLQKSSLEGHVRKHTGEKPFQCSLCPQHFSHRGYLRDHMKIHDENRQRKHKCSVCDKAFTCSSHLRSHERLHSGDKPHKCEVCGSRFTKRSSVKKHLRRTHGIQSTAMGCVEAVDVVANAPAVAAKVPSLTHVQPVGGVPDQGERHDFPLGRQNQGQTEMQTSTEGLTHQQTDTQTEALTPMHTDRLTEGLTHQHTDNQMEALAHLHTDRPTEFRLVESVGVALSTNSELPLPHMTARPDMLSTLHTQLPHSVGVGSHMIHPALYHQIHQYPGIQILHPGFHAAVHVPRETQVIPCIASSVSAPGQPTEGMLHEMQVYTLAS